jgi:cytoskeleton protein RodZ
MILRKSKEGIPLPVDMTNFGASLKKARESKGISLEQIAKETRISTRFLAAIENEEFELLPGGVFNRGFVRAFAEQVGLDADQAVADYDRLVGKPEPVAAPPPEAEKPSRTERHLYPIAIGVLGLAIAVFYVVTRESGHTTQTPTTAPVAATPAAAPQQPAPAPASQPDTNAAANPPAPIEPEPAAQAPAALPPPTAPPSPAATAPQSQALRLDIEATAQTWIKVMSDGNSVNPGEVLEPGMTRKFTADNSIRISIGNAAGLSLKINDKPLKPLGKRGEVRSVTITPANLKDFIG